MSGKEWFVTKDHIVVTYIKQKLANDKLAVQIPGDAAGCCIEGVKKCAESGLLICDVQGVWKESGVGC